MKFQDFKVCKLSALNCAIEVLDQSMGSKECKVLNCLNPHSFVVAKSDSLFESALKHSTWLIPDGIGIVLADRFFLGSLRERLTGPDLFESMMNELSHRKGSVVFFGSSNNNLQKIASAMSSSYPGVKVLDLISPPFVNELSENQNKEAVNRINRLSPDVLWVGMTAPKQEKWIQRNRKSLNVGVAAGVGAVFDFASGNVSRAPLLIRKIGLEWLYRFFSNPRRLAVRTFRSAPLFVFYVVIERLRAFRLKNHLNK